MLEIITDKKLLKRKSTRVAKIDDSIRNICAALSDVMLNSNGIGIAAPQCNILKRIIVVKTIDDILFLINPEILSYSTETEICSEGCLSIPNQYFEKERPKTITVKYRNTKGKPVISQFTGLDARIILHEIDHLEGVTLLD